ncbi:MAG: YcxB family protein [Lachnospiraceae bacterium]|nr:YcxB family protein [Lachnospiraceae bacterium]
MTSAEITIHYEVGVRELNQALLYALVVRRRRIFRLSLYVILAVCFYIACCYAGIVPLYPLILFIGTLCVIWILMQLSGVFLSVRKMVDEDSGAKGAGIIGAPSVMKLCPESLKYSVPEKHLSNRVNLRNIAAVIELPRVYMIYISSADTFLLPKRAMDSDMLTQVHDYFTKRIPEKFMSSYDAQGHAQRNMISSLFRS